MVFEIKDGVFRHTTRTPSLFGGTAIIEYSAKFDGKDYEIQGSGLDSVSLKKIDANTIERTAKKAAKLPKPAR